MLWHRCSRRVAFAFVVVAVAAVGDAGRADELPPVEDIDLRLFDSSRSALPTSQEEFLQYRRQKVAKVAHLGLYPENYTPSADVYRLTYGEPWTRTSDFYINNPHLLIIPTPQGSTRPITYFAPEDNPPSERQIVHDAEKIRERYTGTSANHWMSWAFSGGTRTQLTGTNARDAGFSYAMLDMEKSANINIEKSGRVARAPTPFKDIFHYGNNVSANNLSPNDGNMQVLAEDALLPITLHIRLWREQPVSGDIAPDYQYVIEVEPDPDAKDYESITGITGTPLDYLFDEDVYEILSVSGFTSLLYPLLFLALGFGVGRYAERRHYRRIKRREQALGHIPVTTSWQYDTSRAVEDVRLVYGSVAVSVDYFKRFLSFFRKLAGGEVKSYSSLIDRARREAILRVKESEPDCDIFVNCRLVTASVTGRGGRSTACVEVIAYATAIRYKK